MVVGGVQFYPTIKPERWRTEASRGIVFNFKAFHLNKGTDIIVALGYILTRHINCKRLREDR